MSKVPTVRVKRMIDGDTFETSKGEAIRLANVNAPELGDPGGYAAKLQLQRAIDGSLISIYPKRIDWYGRTIAVIKR